MFLPDCGSAIEDRDLDLDQCRVRGHGLWAVCGSNPRALHSGDSGRLACWLQFPEGQAQRQLDQGAWGLEGPACGGITGQVRPAGPVQCWGPVGCLAGPVSSMSFHFCLLSQIPFQPIHARHERGTGEFV